MFCTGQKNVCAFYPEFPHSKIVCEWSAPDRRTCVLFTLNFHLPRLSFCTGQNVCAFYPEFPHSKIVCECSALDRTCVPFTLNFHIPRLSVNVLRWTERVCLLP